MEALLMAAGMAVSAFSAIQGAADASKISSNDQEIARQELNVNNEKRKAMEIDARRRLLEMNRNSQRARSLAQTAAVSGGSEKGSGLQGAYGGIAGQTNTNELGVNQNLEIGRNIFGFDSRISELRIANSGIQGDQAQWQALGSLGGAITGSAGKVGQMSQGASNPFSMFTRGFGSGDPNG